MAAADDDAPFPLPPIEETGAVQKELQYRLRWPAASAALTST